MTLNELIERATALRDAGLSGDTVVRIDSEGEGEYSCPLTTLEVYTGYKSDKMEPFIILHDGITSHEAAGYWEEDNPEETTIWKEEWDKLERSATAY